MFYFEQTITDVKLYNEIQFIKPFASQLYHDYKYFKIYRHNIYVYFLYKIVIKDLRGLKNSDKQTSFVFILLKERFIYMKKW